MEGPHCCLQYREETVRRVASENNCVKGQTLLSQLLPSTCNLNAKDLFLCNISLCRSTDM